MDMRKTTVVIIAAALAVTVHGKPNDEEKSPHLWEPRVESVTVFKNGLGFFQRKGSVILRDGWCTADAVPPACFGALSIYSHAENELVDIVGSGPGEVVEFDGVDASDEPEQVKAVLKSYLHMKVQLSYLQGGKERQAAGRLVSVSNEYAVLKNEEQCFAVPMEGIGKLQVLEKPLRVHVDAKDSNESEETVLGMAYLRKGITWVPEYTLELIDDETAELTLRGTLVNEAEDLVHCDVNFVVGVPNFLHTDQLAPVAVGQVIRSIGAAVSTPNISRQMINGAFYNNISNNAQPSLAGLVESPVVGTGRDLGQMMGNLPSWEGAGSSDFKVYTREDLTLRRGEKAIVTLFVKRIKYRHIYRWAPPGNIRHLLVLKNDTDTPWTTGPCLAISEGNALSEDLLKYVPQGGSGEFPVTTAVNIVQKQQENEVDRKLKAHEPKHNVFVDLVSLDGKLQVRNYDKMPLQLAIDLHLKGRPLTATDEGTIQLGTENLKLLERSGLVRWTIELKPGEERELGYSYERYVSSY